MNPNICPACGWPIKLQGNTTSSLVSFNSLSHELLQECQASLATFEIIKNNLPEGHLLNTWALASRIESLTISINKALGQQP